MNDRLQEQNAEPFMNLLETIFEIHESSGLRGALEIRGIGQFSLIDNLNYLLNDESIYVLLDTLLDNPDSYRFQIGLILSQVNLTNLPDKVKAKIKPTLTDTEMQLLPEHGRWWLCGAAEPRLVQSLQDNAILLINNKILMKYNGKFSGICLETFANKEGYTFIEGCWYAPTDDISRTAMRTAFDQGDATLNFNEGVWVILRPLSNTRNISAGELLEYAKKQAYNLPPTLPQIINGKSRAEYRNENRETM
jgi:hypothetical protein